MKILKEECLTESVTWESFDKFEPIIDKYMPDRGEGDTMASQIVTAVNKLVYKWFNDGDVFDNTGHLNGWWNDLSSYANWLAEYVPESRGTLSGIYDCYNDQEYAELLYNLCEELLREDILKTYDTAKEGSIYKCDGPYKYIEYNDEDDEEEY